MNARAKTTSALIEEHMEAAYRLAEKFVISEAREIMRKHKDLREFVCAMGGCHFDNASGDPVHLHDRTYTKSLGEFISDHDDALHITGIGMRFTARGRVIRKW